MSGKTPIDEDRKAGPSKAERLSEIERRRARHGLALASLEAAAATWSWLRLLAFILALFVGSVLLLRFGLGAGLLGLALGATHFVYALRRHLRIEAALRRRRAWITLAGEQLARGRHHWSELRPARAAQPDPQHPTELDLDLVGPRGLHRLIDTSASEAGGQRLRAWLGAARPDPAQARTRQALVRELSDARAFRERLALRGRLAEDGSAGYRSDRLLRFLEARFPYATLARHSRLLLVLAGLNLALWWWQHQHGGRAWWALSFGIYGLASLRHAGLVLPSFEVANALGDGLEQLRGVLDLLERQTDPRRPRLAALCRPLVEDGPSAAMSGLRRTIAAAALRGNIFVWLPLNALLPWDHLVALRLERQRAQLAAQLPGWLEIWWDLEAAAALANLAWLDPGLSFPEILDTHGEGGPGSGGNARPLLRATGLCHPLLPDAVKVGNDLRIDRLGEVHLITGSNMAGKSTWLRSVGINLSLAFAGGPVDARSFETIPLALFACTRVSDSLTDGISYFYAEVQRLRALLDSFEAAPAAPLLWLVDEIFRGTNNRERRIGSTAMIEAMAGLNGVGMVSTHDLELAELAGRVDAIHNFHFRERVEGRRLLFDFRLRPGPCPSSNALLLMAAAGLPVDPHAADLAPDLADGDAGSDSVSKQA